MGMAGSLASECHFSVLAGTGAVVFGRECGQDVTRPCSDVCCFMLSVR